MTKAYTVSPIIREQLLNAVRNNTNKKTLTAQHQLFQENRSTIQNIAISRINDIEHNVSINTSIKKTR